MIQLDLRIFFKGVGNPPVNQKRTIFRCENPEAQSVAKLLHLTVESFGNLEPLCEVSWRTLGFGVGWLVGWFVKLLVSGWDC